MSTERQIRAAIFDMDGLLIDSEPLWDRAEHEVLSELGVDFTRRHELPDTRGLRIDLVVDLWFGQQPWSGPDRAAVVERMIARVISLVEQTRPLLPGVREAVALCKAQGLKVGLASASPLYMRAHALHCCPGSGKPTRPALRSGRREAAVSGIPHPRKFVRLIMMRARIVPANANPIIKMKHCFIFI